MRYTAFISCLLLCAASVQPLGAQNIDKVRRRMAQSSQTDGSWVRVRESGNAASAVRRGEASTPHAVNGYRIVIFFDNSATARAEAERRMAEFTAAFPDVRCDLRYENPYFKVVAGACATADDAVMLVERVRRDFPQAYIMREEIPAERFVSPNAHKDNALGDE